MTHSFTHPPSSLFAVFPHQDAGEEAETLRSTLSRVADECDEAKGEVRNLSGKVRGLESVLEEMRRAADSREERERERKKRGHRRKNGSFLSARAWSNKSIQAFSLEVRRSVNCLCTRYIKFGASTAYILYVA